MNDADVLIVGGGPCGCAAALTLRLRRGHRVVVLEGSREESSRPGETVSSAFQPLLGYLGVADALSDGRLARPSFSREAAWGSEAVVARDSLFAAGGPGFFIDRCRLDHLLAARVAAAGGEVLHGAWLRHAERSADGWKVRFDLDGATHTTTARQVIDATGRRAAFARRAGHRVTPIDRLVAVMQPFTPAADRPLSPSTLVESTEDGWWYSAPLPDGHGVLAFMTDADLLVESRVSSPEVFDVRLARTRVTRERVRGCRCSTAPRVVPCATQALCAPLGDAWIAAGDAAVALDPLASLGLGWALESGIAAARAADGRLRGGEALASRYGSLARLYLERFLSHRQIVYAGEGRWQAAPFWQRRARAVQGEGVALGLA